MYTKDELRSIFQQPYNHEAWKTIVNDFFHVDLRPTPQDLGMDDGNHGYFLGKADTDLGLTIGFFYYRVHNGSVLRKRVGLRKLVKPFLDYQVEATIVVFQDDSHWRLSFISDYNHHTTAPKRFTYVFGESTQYYNTPVDRLYKLKDKPFSLANLHDTFSVEALSDEFFDEYKEQYEKFCGYLYAHRSNATQFGPEFAKWDEKLLRNYVKKMMGRLVFLQFVQKKGWLGNGANYLQNLFKSYPNQDDFLDEVLEPLFFGVFNTPPADRHSIFELEGWNLSLLTEWKDVPFLSGGLFDRDKLDEPNSKFPKEYFEGLFVFFSNYNFTIDENDPNDAEIGVDPEMLGKIFENLLEDNKDKGAYYTPKEIVHYMSCESIIQYLKSHTDEHLHADIEALVNHNEISEGSLLREGKVAKEISQLLKDVKVCDPAIGSGAFPMGVLNVIYNCRRALHEANSTEEINTVGIKKQIIQNNIYGVDIEQGAVDIARLRFWLALLVDAKEKETLPNLNYKIMRGNSLITTFDGQYINLDDSQSHIGIAEIKNKKTKLKVLQNEYYGLVGDIKLEKEVEIKKTILDIIALQIGTEIRIWQHQHAEDGTLTGFETFTELKSKLPEEKQRVMEKGAIIRQRLEDMAISLYDRASTPLDFFDWHIMFSDVFENKGGFDIVIGNPPYIKEYTNRYAFDGFREFSPYYIGKMDLWYGFTCHGIDWLTSDGVLSFIAQNNWTTSSGAKLLRDKIVEDTRILKMVDFNDYMVFGESASIQTMIMIFQKDAKNDNYVLDYRKLNSKSTKQGMLEILRCEGNHQYISPVFSKNHFRNNFITFSSNEPILNKIAQQVERLREYEIAQGIVFPQDFLNKKGQQKLGKYSVGDGIFGLTETELENLNLNKNELSLIKPYYTTDQIHKYYTYEGRNTLWLIYTGSTYKDPQSLNAYPNIKEHLDRFLPIFTSDNKPYGLHRSRNESFFKGEKIISLRKCVGHPCFSYSDFDCYFTQTFNSIKTIRWDNIFLTGLLNSKLVEFWLRHKGKMQGENFQIDKEPLTQIPLPYPIPEKYISQIKKHVNTIITAKKHNADAITTIEENCIDYLIYRLYNLTYDEVLMIDPISNITREEYESYNIN